MTYFKRECANNDVLLYLLHFYLFEAITRAVASVRVCVCKCVLVQVVFTL